MISIRELSFSYKQQQPLFTNLNLDIKAGSITGLLGKNGAGKTSLLKMIIGLHYPQTGGIDVMGHTPAKRQPSLLSDLFFVPEEFYLPAVTIKKFIAANSGFYPRFDSAIMGRLLVEFELSPDRHIHKLSYGLKKKFLIAFALSTKCRLLVLDEPTNGLDISSKSTFRKIMAGTLDDDQLVLISTHQVKDVENLIDRLVIVDSGKVILDKDMLDIAAQLRFTTSATSGSEEALYTEAVFGGYKMITPQTGEDSSFVDIELLFNALIKGVRLFETEKVITTH